MDLDLGVWVLLLIALEFLESTASLHFSFSQMDAEKVYYRRRRTRKGRRRRGD